MMLPRRHLLLSTGLAGIALAGCVPSAPRPTETATLSKVTVGLTYIPNIQFSPFYVAVAEGMFTSRLLEVTLRHHGAQEDTFGALVSGEEQAVFGSSDEAVVAAGNVGDLRTFATGFQRFPVVVIVAEDSPIRELADLKGRSVGIPGHFGSTYYAALAGLHSAGLTESDVALTDIGYTQVSALTTAKVDAIVGYSNNEAVQFATSGFPVRQLPVTDAASPSLVGPGLMTLEGTLSEQVLRGLALGMKEAEQAIIDRPELALEATMAHVPTLADETQRRAAEAVLQATSELWKDDAGEVSVEVDAEAFERMGAFLVEVGIIDQAPAESTILL